MSSGGLSRPRRRTSAPGQSRRSDRVSITADLPRSADISSICPHGSKVKRKFWEIPSGRAACIMIRGCRIRSDGPGPVDRVVEDRCERHADRLHIPAPVDDHLPQSVQLCRMLVGVPDTNLHDRALARRPHKSE
jgi:hypothetical protein